MGCWTKKKMFECLLTHMLVRYAIVQLTCGGEAQGLTSSETTFLLRNLLKDYDKRKIPTVSGGPVHVTIQIFIEDMVPMEPINDHYSLDIYVRIYWEDRGLSFGNDYIKYINYTGKKLKAIVLNHKFVESIWSPDIYFPVAKIMKLHRITMPNRLIRLQPDGRIFYSQRLTITAFCDMNLRNFPFDQQFCKFPIRSIGYDRSLMTLDWHNTSGGPIFPPVDKSMLEYTFKGFRAGKGLRYVGVLGILDELWVEFHFTRNTAYYLLQMFMPCIYIVVLSWIGFWIDHRSTPARVSLGITTVLTMATLSHSIRSSTPPAKYTKSLDIYLLVCFFYVFAALVEYAIVGVTHIKWQKVFDKEALKKQLKFKSGSESGSSVCFSRTQSINSTGSTKTFLRSLSNLSEISSTSTTDSIMLSSRSTRSGVCNVRFSDIDFEDTRKRHESQQRPRNTWQRATAKINTKMLEKQRKNEEKHVIDAISRYAFPISFIIFNVAFFSYYLTRYTV